MKTFGYAAKSSTSPLAPFQFERREVGPQDVQIEILYCGICHSDLHIVRNDWNMTVYPVVPGHEIVGKVVKLGDKVQKFKLNDLVAVGCMVNSCGNCSACKMHEEQYCEKGFTLTYNSPDNKTGQMTYGGYSNQIVVTQNFVLSVPPSLEISAVAPLLCAGITTYSPLMHWKINKKSKVGIVGLGGLGHMAVKLARALGAHVTMITSSVNKEKDAKRLGANDVILSTNKALMNKYTKQFDLIIDTVPVKHNVNPYIKLLKHDGVLVNVGVIDVLEPPIDNRELVFSRRSIAGSLIGGIQETQEMLEFCAKHQVLPDVEIIPIQKVNEAYERLLKNDVKYRFVIDMSSLKETQAS